MLSTKSASSALVLVAISTLAFGAGCASKNSSSQLASDTTGAEDVTTTESNMEILGSSFVGSDGQSVASPTAAPLSSGDLQAQGLTTVGNPGFWFQPAGCEQTTVDTANQKASYVFKGCTGPLGLVAVTGTVNLTWQLAAGQLTLNLSAQNFEINAATISSWQATAVITASGTQRTMTWNAQLSGTTGSGRTFMRTNQKSLAWDTGVACLAVSGQSTGNILGVTLQVTETSYKRCADSCPEAGSAISIKDLGNGEELAISYLGGPRADLTINGKTEEIGLACGL